MTMSIQPAINAGTEASSQRYGTDNEIPFCRTVITDDAQQAALRVLSGGWVTMGAETAAFEEEFASWTGARHAVAVSSCTAAIEIALTALDLPPGSPVLTPTLTFCGAVQAIVHAGLRPVLVDADERTLTVSTEGVGAAARRGAAAMVVQDMAGYAVDIPELAAAAGIPIDNVVEDAAHGLGASLRGRAVGSDGRAVCFSFYATKNLPIGEGGAITTTDTGCRVNSRPSSASVVFAGRNVVAFLAGSYQQHIELNLPRSMARMRPSIACLRAGGIS
jgi:perosamine synthetase